jgi:hypothetical protein
MGSEVAPRKEHIIKKSAIRAGEEIVWEKINQQK